MVLGQVFVDVFLRARKDLMTSQPFKWTDIATGRREEEGHLRSILRFQVHGMGWNLTKSFLHNRLTELGGCVGQTHTLLGRCFLQDLLVPFEGKLKGRRMFGGVSFVSTRIFFF